MKKTKNRIIAAVTIAVITTFIPQVCLGASPLKAPEKIRAAKITSTAITINWKKTAHADGYHIYQKSPGNSRYCIIKTLKSSKKTTWTVKKLKPGKTYNYRLRSFRKEQKSRFSKTLRIKTKEKKESEDSLKDRLAELDGVVKVTSVKQNALDEKGNPQYRYKSKYLVIFRQPLDWKNKSEGSFTQRVLIGINDTEAINAAETQGYLIPEKKIENDPRSDQEVLLDSNYIEIEHRYFGESKPEGLSNDSTDLWQYLTAYNAASDQNKVITELKKVLPGKWIATGASKGGLTANILTMYYPRAVDLTVSYVAPLSENNDTRFYDFVYNKAESINYGEKEREMMKAFQFEALKNREALSPLYKQALKENNYKFRDHVTEDALFDICVLEAAVNRWQYYQDFETVKKCLSMPERNETEKKEKTEKMFKILEQTLTESNIDSSYYPYFVQTAKELGHYVYDFTYLRSYIADKTGEDPNKYFSDCTVRNSFRYKATDMLFTDDQKRAFQYDPSLHEELTEWVHTTDSKVIMIYGSSDPWYSVRIPDAAENENIKIFVSTRTPHTTAITDIRAKKNGDYSFSKKEYLEICTTINDWLQ